MATELKWLEQYTGQTTDELIALEGEYRTDSIVLAFEDALDKKSERIVEIGLSEEERIVLAVEALEREVNNGGYLQFFSSPSGVYAPMIVEALERIGSTTAGRISSDAIAALGIDGPINVGAINRAISEESPERDEALDELDGQYYTAAGDLSALLFEFIKENRKKIILQD